MDDSILIADSGATKTAWVYLEKSKVTRFTTAGISPYHMSQPQIESLVKKEFPKKILFNMKK